MQEQPHALLSVAQLHYTWNIDLKMKSMHAWRLVAMFLITVTTSTYLTYGREACTIYYRDCCNYPDKF